MGYLRGDFAAPPPADPDYMPLSLGMKALSDLLFNVVRDKYGAVYSPDAYIRDYQVQLRLDHPLQDEGPGQGQGLRRRGGRASRGRQGRRRRPG